MSSLLPRRQEARAWCEPVQTGILNALCPGRTTYGKAILAACFINDLGAVIALGLIFSPFAIRTLIFLGPRAEERARGLTERRPARYFV
jgi:hypothetical protein